MLARMSLRTQAIVATVLMMSSFMVAEYLGASTVLSVGFERIERDAMERSVETLVGHMPFEVAVVAERLGAVAPLEELAGFAARPESDFATRRLAPEALTTAGLDFALLLGTDGRTLHAVVASGAPWSVAEAEAAWNAAVASPDAPRGLLRVGAETAIVASAPLRHPELGTLSGVWVVGRHLDEALIAQMEELTHLSIAVEPWDAERPSAPFAAARAQIVGGRARPVETVDDATIVGFTRLYDVAGAPLLLVRVATPRPIAAQARQSRTTLLLTTAGVGAVLVLLFVGLLQRGLLDRFLRMSQAVRRIAAEGDTGLRLDVVGTDELAQLGRDVNGMLTALEGSQAALRESEARYALAAAGANDGLWDWDLRSDEVLYSARFMAMLGHRPEEVRGAWRWWRDRIHPDDVARFDAKLAAFRSGAAPVFEDEHRLALREGGWRWMLVRGAATWAGSEPERMAGSLTDITDRGVFDPLTGLPNRALLAGRLAQAVARARRRSEPGPALLAIEADRYRALHDGSGPEAADALVVEVGRRVVAALRAGDLVARTGPGEFVALLEEVVAGDATSAVVARLQRSLEAPWRLEGDPVSTAVTVGVVADLSGYDAADQIVRDAEIARDHARAERAPVAWFDRAMHERLVGRQRTESELRAAIEAGALALHYQPIVRLDGGGLHGFEALVRWPHPTRGLLSPAAFIDLAEDTGLVVPLGAWVLHEACRQARRFADAGAPWAGALVHVNLSARQLGEPGLADLVRRALEGAGVAPERLELEVTESAMMAHAAAAARALEEIAALGVRLAIDDFGTGHSSLAYLHDLPMHTLKVDRSFVSRMEEDRRSHKIVQTVVQLAQGLGMGVVAEGIETEGQQTALRTMGVRLGQGYLFARPLPAEEALAWGRAVPGAD